MKILSVGLVLALAGGAWAEASKESTLRADLAWIRPAAQGQFETWAFATIVNPGRADALVEVSSPDAGSVVLRAATVTDAGRKVRSLAAIPIPAKGELRLSADTYFFAFIDAKHSFSAGHSVTATLRFASGVRLPVTFQVGEAATDSDEPGN